MSRHQHQQAVCLPADKTGEPSQTASLPAFDPSQDASKLYAELFEASNINSITTQELPLNQHLDSADRIVLIHATSTAQDQPTNRFANEILLQQVQDGADRPEAVSNIHGKAYVLYAESESGKDFTLNVDWQALHDVCYGARLSSMGSKSSDKEGVDVHELAEQFIKTREQLLARHSAAKDAKMEEDDDEAWTDEEVEKPREPRKEVESDDDDEMDGNAEGEDEDEEEEEDEDSEGSYEDESELESDDDDDPRKKALLEMIQQAIMKDGKLDLERLGLVEKNGKLVPKDK